MRQNGTEIRKLPNKCSVVLLFSYNRIATSFVIFSSMDSSTSRKYEGTHRNLSALESGEISLMNLSISETGEVVAPFGPPEVLAMDTRKSESDEVSAMDLSTIRSGKNGTVN